MKKFRAVVYLLLFFAGIILLIIFLSNFINSRLDQSKTPSQTTVNVSSSVTSTNPGDQSTQPPSTTPTTPATITTFDPRTLGAVPATSAPTTTSAGTDSTTVSLVDSSTSYYPLIGTVKSKNTISLFPQTGGSVKKVYFQEGDFVNTGDTIVELTGNNLTEHASETQLKIAQTNLNNAKTALENLRKTNAESLKTANLQLQSAVDQANAIAFDLATIEQNQSGLQDGLQTLQNSLDNTRAKNQRDIIKSQTDIQNLIYSLNSAQDERARTQQKINDLQNQIDQLPIESSPSGAAAATADTTASTSLSQTTLPQLSASRSSLEALRQQLQTTLAAQTKAIDALYDSIDKSKYGLDTLENTSQLSDNAILGQIKTSQNQQKVLDLTYNSTKTKLGYTGDSSGALRLAEQAYNSTKVLLSTTLVTAENQVKIAQLNYDLAANSASALTIKSPFTGQLSSLDLSPGQQVNPQSAIAEIISTQAYELEVNIDPDIADRVDLSHTATVELAGRILEVPIKSVAPTVNGITHLVKIRLTLPPITFKANQTLNAQIPLRTSTPGQTGNSGKTSFLPLDAVIIGTESQFVYVNDNGKARKVQVTLGQISGDQVEILSGLTASDRVILQGAKDLTDGQTIQTK